MINENRLIDELRKSNLHHASNSREEALLDRTIRIVKGQPKVGEWIPFNKKETKEESQKKKDYIYVALMKEKQND